MSNPLCSLHYHDLFAKESIITVRPVMADIRDGRQRSRRSPRDDLRRQDGKTNRDERATTKRREEDFVHDVTFARRLRFSSTATIKAHQPSESVVSLEFQNALLRWRDVAATKRNSPSLQRAKPISYEPRRPRGKITWKGERLLFTKLSLTDKCIVASRYAKFEMGAAPRRYAALFN